MKTDPPLLKWAGGKRWLVPHLLHRWTPHYDKTLVELFCGGCAVTFGLRPPAAVLVDKNRDLINFYERVQDGTIALGMMPTVHDEHTYYHVRECFNAVTLEQKPEVRAAWFYYLNQTCFNGLCRYNSAGGFNTPYGHFKRTPKAFDLAAYQNIFSSYYFKCGDFNAYLPSLLSTDVLYADPPYDGSFNTYTADGFEWNDRIRLAYGLSRHAGPVIVSDRATDRVIELYGDLKFELEYVDGPRRINPDGDRTPVKELLAFRNFQ
jgi:DNA adenine methylase